MSEPRKTSGCTLTSTIQQQQQPEDNRTTRAVPAPKDRRRKRSSPSSHVTSSGSNFMASRRRSAVTSESTTGPNAGSSRTAQRLTSSLNNISNMSAVNYTRTGRVSKAKKGLKVHVCECGRVSVIHSHCCRCTTCSQLTFAIASAVIRGSY